MLLRAHECTETKTSNMKRQQTRAKKNKSPRSLSLLILPERTCHVRRYSTHVYVFYETVRDISSLRWSEVPGMLN